MGKMPKPPKPKVPKRRSPVAAKLADPRFRPRVTPNKGVTKRKAPPEADIEFEDPNNDGG